MSRWVIKRLISKKRSNMKRSFVKSILLLVVLVVIPASGFAQDFRNMELNPFVAGSAHTKSEYEIGFPQSISPIQSEFRMSDTIRGGLRFNVNTTGRWGEELFFSYEPNRVHFVRKTAPTQDQAYDLR